MDDGDGAGAGATIEDEGIHLNSDVDFSSPPFSRLFQAIAAAAAAASSMVDQRHVTTAKQEPKVTTSPLEEESVFVVDPNITPPPPPSIADRPSTSSASLTSTKDNHHHPVVRRPRKSVLGIRRTNTTSSREKKMALHTNTTTIDGGDVPPLIMMTKKRRVDSSQKRVVAELLRERLQEQEQRKQINPPSAAPIAAQIPPPPQLSPQLLELFGQFLLNAAAGANTNDNKPFEGEAEAEVEDDSGNFSTLDVSSPNASASAAALSLQMLLASSTNAQQSSMQLSNNAQQSLQQISLFSNHHNNNDSSHSSPSPLHNDLNTSQINPSMIFSSSAFNQQQVKGVKNEPSSSSSSAPAFISHQQQAFPNTPLHLFNSEFTLQNIIAEAILSNSISRSAAAAMEIEPNNNINLLQSLLAALNDSNSGGGDAGTATAFNGSPAFDWATITSAPAPGAFDFSSILSNAAASTTAAMPMPAQYKNGSASQSATAAATGYDGPILKKDTPIGNTNRKRPRVSATAASSIRSTTAVLQSSQCNKGGGGGETTNDTAAAVAAELMDLEELEEFANNFKKQRIKHGFTQGDVGLALGKRYGTDFSQTTISRFEALNLSFKNMCKLRPLLKEWLEETEALIADGATVTDILEAPSPGEMMLMGEGDDNGVGGGGGGEGSHQGSGGGGTRLSSSSPIIVGGGGQQQQQHHHHNRHAFIPQLRRRRKRTNLDNAQRASLNSYFEANCRPDHQRMIEIANSLDLDPDVVRVWYCNRRQKLRKIDSTVDN